jgi:hypothetical protein
LKSLFEIPIAFTDKDISSLFEQVQNFGVNLVQVLDSITRRSFYDILWLRDTDLLEYYACSLLDVGY